MYQHRANVTPPHVDLLEAHTRAKFAYYRNAEAAINAGPAKVEYWPAPVRARNETPQHGTHSGYKTHILAKTEPCTECRAARAIYQRQYRARKCAA